MYNENITIRIFYMQYYELHNNRKMFSYILLLTRKVLFLCFKNWQTKNTTIQLIDARMMLGPKRKPNTSKYIIWTGSVRLTDSSSYLHGPFNFGSTSNVITAKQNVVLTHWEYCLTACHTFSIVPSILSTLTAVKRSTKKQKKRTYPQLHYYTQIHTSYSQYSYTYWCYIMIG